MALHLNIFCFVDFDPLGKIHKILKFPNLQRYLRNFFACELDCSKLHFWSRINFIFFLSMCLGKTRPHAKFQVSSLNILSWRPVFVIEIQ